MDADAGKYKIMPWSNEGRRKMAVWIPLQSAQTALQATMTSKDAKSQITCRGEGQRLSSNHK
jgi:hypothetical protein